MTRERKTREQIRAEWEAIGLEPRQQAPDEMRRVLMTWSKAQLVEWVIRAESDEIRARHNMLKAWADTAAFRQYALILPSETKRHEIGAPNPFNAWLINHKGQTLDAKVVFMEGWKARARADDATTEHWAPAQVDQS